MGHSIALNFQDGVTRCRLADKGIAPVNFLYQKFSPGGAVTTMGKSHRQAA